MSRIGILIVMTAIFTTGATADPLLTKAEIAKRATNLEACLAKQTAASPGKPSAYIGVIQGPCDDAVSAGGEAAHATCADNGTAAWDLLLNKRWAELAAGMDKAKFDSLKSVQNLWLSYRDAKCAFLRQDDETMMGYMNAAFCRLKPRAARASFANLPVERRTTDRTPPTSSISNSSLLH